MPHFPKPFFRTARSAWFVQVGGRQVKLHENEAEAFRLYHALMAERSKSPAASAAGGSPPEPAEPLPRLVVEVVDEFLDWCQKHRRPDTYRWYKDRLNSFCDSIPEDLAVDRLRPFHVQKWVDGQPDLAAGSKRNLIASVKRAMKWAEEQGYVDRSPVAHLRKPGCGRKDQVVSPAEYARLLELTKDQAFKDLLTVTWETGARPQETLRVEARHVHLGDNARWVFPAAESKGGKHPRVVYLTPAAVKISKRSMKKHPTGPLFRNTDGLAWTPDATNCRFQTLKRKTGKKYSLYALRHTFATRALQRGVDSMTVALLLGHSDPSMLAKHYQHLCQSPEFLSGQAKRASA